MFDDGSEGILEGGGGLTQGWDKFLELCELEVISVSGMAAAMGPGGFVTWERAWEGFFRAGEALSLAVLLLTAQSAL